MSHIHDGGLGTVHDTNFPAVEVSTAAALQRPGVTGGAKRKKPANVPHQAKVRHSDTGHNFVLQQWAVELLQRNAPVEEIIAAAVAQVRERPGERTLFEAQVVINELGRSPKHTEMVHTMVTSELFNLLIAREEVSR